ncbi:MAG: Holliday junction branch migration protein RuvA [Eubacteriales bacterium]|nr:Holliday junction branch migration protein RuvA [Lachnospiraceae bacterium]MDO5127769.1 Holliday junction branch migration protein RuvA [Eubacteriales bacterium]
MIEYIHGVVTYIEQDRVILENQGIGYCIFTSSNTIGKLRIKDTASIFTHLHVREDDISLFGFATRDELNAFELLIKINGIGPKGALSVLSVLSMEELRMAVLSEDAKAIAKANGIGTKTAQRVIMELKDKFKLDDVFGDISAPSDLSEGDNHDMITEAAMALTSLGYSNVEALRAIKKVEDYETLSVEQLLKEALKRMS